MAPESSNLRARGLDRRQLDSVYTFEIATYKLRGASGAPGEPVCQERRAIKTTINARSAIARDSEAFPPALEERKIHDLPASLKRTEARAVVRLGAASCPSP